MNRGFIQIPILIAIIIGTAVIGGGGYFVAKEISKPTPAVHTEVNEDSEVNLTEQEATVSPQESETPPIPLTQTPAASHQPSPTQGIVPPVQIPQKEAVAPTQINSTNTNTTAEAGITVPAAPPTPKVKVTASPSSVEYGGTSVISWEATDALSCTLGSSPALLAVKGSQSVSLADSSKDWSESYKKTYSVTCTGAGGSVSEDVIVSVKAWKPSAKCQKDYENKKEIEKRVYHNEMSPINPGFCIKMEM